MYCEECGREVAAYFGESGRNGYTRGKEHFEKKLAKDEDNSVLWLHSLHHHQGRVDINYTMQVTGSYTEPLDCQTMERVLISSFKGPVLMNRRNEMGGVRVERMQYWRWGMGILHHPRRSPLTSFQTTSEEKWSTGRWSPEGDGGVEEEELQFLARGLFQTSGVSVWWGAFPQCGNIPLLMTGSQI